MISDLDIEGYRGLKSLKMNGFGRINLLVGKNNSGKSSVLEALHLLGAQSNILSAIALVCGGRDEILPPDESLTKRLMSDIESDISHLFTGHELEIGKNLYVRATDRAAKRVLSLKITDPTGDELSAEDTQVDLLDLSSGQNEALTPRLALTITGLADTKVLLSRRGGLSYNAIERVQRLKRSISDQSAVKTVTIPTGSSSPPELARALNAAIDARREKDVVTALNFLDSDIEDIFPIAEMPRYISRGGIKLGLKGGHKRVPLGSMGDGVRRMLALALQIPQAQDGLLLIDEIDTGLHYTILERMWDFLYKTAQEFNVQVFAATHSSDCVKSLASICQDHTLDQSKVTIHRIEKDKKSSIPYSEEEIKILSLNSIEAR